MDRVYCRQEESYVRAKLMQYSRRRRRGGGGGGGGGDEERRSDSRRPNNRRCNDAPFNRISACRDQASSISASPRRVSPTFSAKYQIEDLQISSTARGRGRTEEDRFSTLQRETVRRTNRELTSFDCSILLISLRIEGRWLVNDQRNEEMVILLYSFSS